MKPSEKNEDLELFLETIFGKSRSESISNNICISCGNTVDVDSFGDALSLREYKISGLCQTCQDSTFGDDNE